MATDNKYSEVLLELKTHYQQTLAELEAQTNQLKTRLTSLDTLIEDPLLGSDLLSVLQGEVDSLTTAAPTSAPKKAKTVEPKAEDKTKKTAPKPSSSSSSKKKSATPKQDASQTAAKTKSQKKTSSASSSILKMNKPYDQMLKVEAIEKIMYENPGKVMHTNDLIMRLFGELSGEEHKAERGRIKSVMYNGVKNNHWRKVPKLKMCYIYEPSLHTGPEKSNSTKGQKSRKKT